MLKTSVKRTDLVFPELSYKIVGILFEVYKNLGSGHLEKYYQRAIGKEFQIAGISFKEQLKMPLKYKEEIIGSGIIDFLIEDKIVLEIKKDKNYSKRNIDQVVDYLKMNNLKLGILANFTSQGVKYKRILNIN